MQNQLVLTISNGQYETYLSGIIRSTFDLEITGAVPSTIRRIHSEGKHGAPRVAKTLRDILMMEIPTIAVDLVWIERNDSCLDDETLAHRLGQIPLSYDNMDAIFAGEDGKFEFTLNVHCQDLTGNNEYCSVRTSNLVPNVPEIRPTMDFEIVKLLKDQVIRLKAETKKGNGHEHAKFSPVSIVSFSPARLDDNGNAVYNFTFETVGSLEPEQCLRTGLALLTAENHYPDAIVHIPDILLSPVATNVEA